MPFRTYLAVLAVTGLSLSTAARSDDSVLRGFWETKDKATIEIAPCDSGLCGTLVDFILPPGITRERAIDRNNPDPAMRARSLYGVHVLEDITPTAPQTWEAEIYLPKNGILTDATITVETPDTIKLTGCVRVAFKICQDEIWTRKN